MEGSKKTRVNPTPKQRERLLDRNAGVCCVCKRRFIGVVIHHIDGDSSNTVYENLAVLCVQDHDEHHRPKRYSRGAGGPSHLELGQEEIRRHKESWESFVSEARKPKPAVVAVVNVFGTEESLHSMKLVFQRDTGSIEFERLYHLHDGPPESWVDLALQEVHWMGSEIAITLVDEPLSVEYCPCCSNSLSSGISSSWLARMTSPSWGTESAASVYINPDRPSLAVVMKFKSEVIFSGSLHLCGQCLHFHCDHFDERIQLSDVDVKAQAIGIVEKVLRDWGPAIVLVGTGDEDKPELISEMDLPDCWQST